MIAPVDLSLRWQVHQGEALASLMALPDASIDGVVTDPPYSSGGAFRGDRMASTKVKYQQTGQALQWGEFSGDNRDQRGFAAWCALWLYECRRACKPGAPICVFTDWRQLPTTTDAIQAGGWVWRGIAPWDKSEAARPMVGRFRAQAEFVVWGSNGPMPEREDIGCLPGAWRFTVGSDDKHHIAGKPVALMAEVCRIVPPGGLILDPFCGSGSTGVGALRIERRFLGFDLGAENVATSRARLEDSSLVKPLRGETQFLALGGA